MMMSDEKSGMNSLDKQILSLNNLLYEPSSELSLSNSHKVRHFPCLSNQTESSQSLYVDISVGSDLINGSDSYISFDLVVSTADGAPVQLPGNGVLSLFRDVICRSSSGQELDRVRNLNLMTSDYNQYQYSVGTNESVGSGLFQGATLANNSVTRVVIPLSWLSPFFRSETLVPTNVIGTIRLEMLLENAVTALITTTNTVPSFRIEKLVVSTDVFSLTDGALRSLAIMAAESGLTYSWGSISTTITKTQGSSANITALKSASRALGAFIHISDTADLTNAQSDSMANEPYSVSTYQFQLGSQYLPSRAIDTPVEGFYNALYSFDSLAHNREFACQVSLSEFLTRRGVIATTLERSSVLQNNGQAVSSSRPLIAQVEFTNGADRTHFLFLTYTRLLMAFSPSSLVLKE
jgi:hypothetical protein